MAQRVLTLYVDDIDGSEAIGTTTFSLDGREYEIDLSESNRAKLEKSIQLYVMHARSIGGKTRAVRAGNGKPARRQDLAEIRTWARENGYQVSERGRVPAEVIEAYDAR